VQLQGSPGAAEDASNLLKLLCCIWCRLREWRRCIIVLLCGTSGSGKSTLASILVS
jgi:2-phosphoglycerate kinase